MSCTRPTPGWVTEDGTITFKARGPITEADHMIPCGKCDGCHAERRRDWAIRMYHEAQYHNQNSFITLTYDDEHCPEKISVEHLQAFLARLRKKEKVRYFITGEYGEKTHRPHYHAIVFGTDFRGGRFTYNIDDRMWGNKLLDRTWSMGNVTVGDFTLGSAMYTAGYVSKKIDDRDTFSIMSRNPPIGWQWAFDNQEQLRRLEFVVCEGTKLPIPKVYFDWGEETKHRPGEVDLDCVKGNRQMHTKTLWEEELRSKEINYSAMRKMREEKI